MHLRIQSGPVDECVLPDARVFLQVGADTRQVVTAGDAERLQRRTWSDAGTQQQRGAADRAGADQYFAAGAYRRLPSIACDLNAGRAAAVERDRKSVV